MPSKYELAQRQNISKAYLIRLLLICSQRVLVKTSFRNEFQGLFGPDFKKLNIITAYNLVYNAALLTGQSIGYILNPNKLVNAKDRTVCFRPFTPALKAGLGIVWEKYRFFHLLQIFNALQKNLLDKQRPVLSCAD